MSLSDGEYDPSNPAPLPHHSLEGLVFDDYVDLTPVQRAQLSKYATNIWSNLLYANGENCCIVDANLSLIFD